MMINRRRASFNALQLICKSVNSVELFSEKSSLKNVYFPYENLPETKLAFGQH